MKNKGRITCFLISAFFVFSFLGTNKQGVYAACPSGSSCLGTTVVDITFGCTPSCTQEYRSSTISCNANCAYSFQGWICNSSCGIDYIDGYHTGRCCTAGSGSDCEACNCAACPEGQTHIDTGGPVVSTVGCWDLCSQCGTRNCYSEACTETNTAPPSPVDAPLKLRVWDKRGNYWRTYDLSTDPDNPTRIIRACPEVDGDPGGALFVVPNTLTNSKMNNASDYGYFLNVNNWGNWSGGAWEWIDDDCSRDENFCTGYQSFKDKGIPKDGTFEHPWRGDPEINAIPMAKTVKQVTKLNMGGWVLMWNYTKNVCDDTVLHSSSHQGYSWQIEDSCFNCNPSCSGQYNYSSCSGLGCSSPQSTCCSKVDRCGDLCTEQQCINCYSCSAPSPNAPSSLTLRVGSQDYPLSTNSSSPTPIDYTNGGTRKVFSNTAPSNTSYRYEVFNAYSGGSRILNYSGGTRIKPASGSLTYSQTGRFRARFYNNICPNNVQQYSGDRVGYYCMIENKPTISVRSV